MALDPSVLSSVENLRTRFAEAQPFRHVVIDSFLDPAFCRELIAGFPRFETGQSLNEMREPGRKAVVTDLPRLGPAYARFDRLMRDREFLDFVGRITGIERLLYDQEYVGGGTHENLDGQELDTHVDFNYHPTTSLHRRLNLIVFLNDEWQESWGGCLELLRDPWSKDAADRVTVIPLANRAVIFETTEASWHGFRRIQLPPDKPISRRSIAVYFYSADRRVEETAHSHGTVYYQRPLAQQIRPGYTLTENDVEEIEMLLTRRDKHIQLLHSRELKFSQVLDGIRRSPSFLLGRALTWPARTLRALVSKSRSK
jgi:hypothetical protein